MKIAIDAHIITGKFQGTRTTLTKLLSSIAKVPSGHRISLYVEDKKEIDQYSFKNCYNLVEIPKVGSIKRLLSIFPKMLKANSEELAIFQYISPPFSRTPCVIFVHDILPITHGQFFPLMNRLRIWVMFSLSIRSAAMVATVSAYSYEAIQKRFNLQPERLCLILNGPSFDPEIYTAVSHQPTTPRYVMTVGRIEPRKNIDLLVRAFLQADLGEVELVIVGKRDLGFDYQFPDDPRIKNLSGVDDDGLIELYRGASLFVYPSFAEGFGLPLLDALLFGIPTISSNQTAMKEIIKGNGQVFDPTMTDSAEKLASLIAGHFRDEPIASPTNAQRAELRERFNWDNAASTLLKTVSEIKI